jgi:phosphoadenosine phosphosulfate reductase
MSVVLNVNSAPSKTVSQSDTAPALDLVAANNDMKSATPLDIVHYALKYAKCPIISTSFGAHSAALLHIMTRVRPDISVLWVDSGYNTSSTYRFADKLSASLKLNLNVYLPRVSAAHLNTRYRGIPDADTDAHKEFSRIIKIEPFNRAFAELKPDFWFSGIRKEETEFRQTQNIFTFDAARNVIKVSPLFNLSENEVDTYLATHRLPIEHDYFDPTKIAPNRECGLHTYDI